jgi:hypothetical protein
MGEKEGAVRRRCVGFYGVSVGPALNLLGVQKIPAKGSSSQQKIAPQRDDGGVVTSGS